MHKRVIAGLLWAYVSWYAWVSFALLTGLPGQLAPVFALALGVLVAWDPTHRIWGRGTRAARAITATATATLDPTANLG